MRNKLTIFILALLPILGVGQTITGTVDLSRYYTKAQVDSVINAAKLGVVTPPPVVTLPDCKQGPEIRTISDVTATGLKVVFHGVDVFGIDFKVNNAAGQTVSQGAIEPKSNTLLIPYTKQAPGSYTLILSGNTCKGTSSKAFTISGETGSIVEPPVIVVPPTEVPTGQARIIEQVIPFPGHMKLQKVKVQGGWLYSDTRKRSETGLREGFYIFYEVNGKRIVTDQLKDYFVSEKSRAVSITKSAFKNGITDWWRTSPTHGGDDANQGYFQPGHTYAARASDIIVVDNALFPSGYDPVNNQRVQWPDLVANTTAKESFIYVMPKGDTPLETMISKGVNRFSGQTLHSLGEPKNSQMIAAGYGYNEVPISPVIFSWTDKLGHDEWIGPRGRATEDMYRNGVLWKRKGETIDDWPFIWNRRYLLTPEGAQEPMTEEEGRYAGRLFGVDYPLNILETSEQSHAISSHWSFVRTFSDEWHKRLSERWAGTGKSILTAWNYFSDMGMNHSWGSAQDRKDAFRKDLSAWPENPMLPGRNLEKFTAYCVPMYFNFTSAGYETAYELALQYYVQKKTGKHCIVFPAETLENNPNGSVQWRMPDGKYYHKDKLPQDPSIIIAAGALSRIFCKALVPWAFHSYNTKRFGLYNYYIQQNWQQKGLWVPNGNAETQTADINTSNIIGDTPATTPSQGVTDNLAFGKDWAERVFAPTDGGTDEWLRYQMDAGAWVEPKNDWADDAIDAREAKRPLVFSRWKNGIISVLICNAGAQDADAHTIRFQVKGKEYERTIAGIVPHMENLSY
ncbi:MAG: hypothetical protein E6R03_09815 [Hyphomicrobiaceae bacterium]|nr:MAG: hypothetical protein E6R03_09815 [Hyphomicrobiaceae bacterium]